ncbi:transposase [Aureimonas phyllosphaerae]|uniref:transposase n=1 Tax=Aureimonas phyllosphaerae TaxID=1166078 RepID=UPI003A5C00E1
MPDNLALLPLRVRPRIGETPLSLLGRLASRRGADDPARFARSVGLDPVAVSRGHHTAELSILSGLPEAGIAEWSVDQVSESTVVLAGETLRMKSEWCCMDFAEAGRRYCAECLEEDASDGEGGPPEQRAYVRAWWDLRFVRACSRHRILLETRCPRPQCRAIVKHSHVPSHRCMVCRAPFAAKTRTALSEGDMAAEAYVQGRLGIRERMSVPFLDQMSLHQADETMWRLGIVAEMGTERVNRFVETLAPADFCRLASRGFAVCLEGKQGVERLLQSLFDRSAGSINGPTKSYGMLFKWLDTPRYDDNTPKHVETLRGIVRTHAMSEIPMMTTDTLFREDCTSSRYVSIKSASLAAGTQYRTFVRRALDAGMITERDVSLGRFLRGDIPKITSIRTDRLPMGKVSKRLGVTKKHLNRIFELEMLPVVIGPPPAEHRYVRVEDVERFASLVRLDAPLVTVNERDHLRLFAGEVDTWLALQAIVGGTLVPLGASRVGDLKSVVLDRSDLEKGDYLKLPKELREKRRQTQMRTQRAREIESKPKLLSSHATTNRLGTAWASLIGLVQGGLLQSASDGKRIKSGFLEKDVDEFAARYVLSNRLRSEYGMPWSESLRSDLEARGCLVHAVAGFADLFVVQRGDVQRVLSDGLVDRVPSGSPDAGKSTAYDDMGDEEWSVISPLLPTAVQGYARLNDRRTVDGILWHLRTGLPWSDLPDRYGPHSTVRARLTKWDRAGVWNGVLAAMAAALADRFLPIERPGVLMWGGVRTGSRSDLRVVAWWTPPARG